MLQADLEAFHRRVRNAFVAWDQAVKDELARQGVLGQPAGAPARQPVPTSQPAINAPNGHNGSNGSSRYQASQKQLTYYARQLAGQIQGLGAGRLDQLTENMFKPLAELSSFDASSLIDTLKAVKAGQLDLDAAFNGHAGASS